MANQIKIYLDLDDGILYYLDNDNQSHPVKTSASLDPLSVKLTPEGVLQFKDFENNWIQMIDADGNPISLKGAKGDPGEQGLQGERGDVGKTFIPEIDSNYNLSWKINEDLTVPNPVNIKGENGATFIPNVSVDGQISWINDKGLSNPQTMNIKGKNGLTPKIDLEADGVMSVSYSADYTPTSSPQKINIKGPKGDDGATFIPQIGEDGILKWKNNKGLDNPEPVYIKGQAGLTPKIELDESTGLLSVSYSSDFIPDAPVKSMNIKGPKGDTGNMVVPSVTSDGLLTWRESTEVPVEPVNIKGPKGEPGLGFKVEFPENPKLGDTFTWGGDSGLNNNCFLGYVMTGQQYVYSQLPSKLGLTFANEKTCLIPMHVMLYIPDLLQTNTAVIPFHRSEQICPLTFNDNDELIESVTTATNTLGVETKQMSWTVSYGLTDSQIKHLQPYIINIAKSVFDGKVSEYTTNYAFPHRLPKYLQGSAMKCKYSDLLTEGTIFNKLFTFLQENPSNIFTGLQQAIAAKLAANDSYDPDVYIIPIQATPDNNLSKSWISGMPELIEGWAPCDSVLHNGFNTNLVGSISEILEIGEGEVEM